MNTRPKPSMGPPPSGMPGGMSMPGAGYSQGGGAQYSLPGGYGGASTEGPNKTNALILAIFSTLCGCLPLGIWSIVLATKIDGLLVRGDLHGAHAVAKKSRTVAFVSLGISLVAVVAQFALGAFGALSGQ